MSTAAKIEKKIVNETLLGYDVAAKALLDAGADKEARNERDETPLQVAVAFKQIDCVRLLVQHGAVIETEQATTTVLHVAAAQNDEEMVRFLLRSGVDIARRNAQGETALEVLTGGDLLKKDLGGNCK